MDRTVHLEGERKGRVFNDCLGGERMYPPGNDHISHLWKFGKIIDSKLTLKRGYVSFGEGILQNTRFSEHVL